MPWGDGTGPWWGRGYGCGVFRGRGFGRGPGMGFGRRFGGFTYSNPPELTREQETSDLRAYASELEAELSEIKKRLGALEQQKKE